MPKWSLVITKITFLKVNMKYQFGEWYVLRIFYIIGILSNNFAAILVLTKAVLQKKQAAELESFTSR